MYQIIFRPTGEKVGKPYADRARARRRANKLDMAYGSCAHSVVRVGV